LPAPTGPAPAGSSSPAIERAHSGWASSSARGADGIEIELANGRRIRVGADIDAAALKRIIALLEG
jgi:hypothetical protein